MFKRFAVLLFSLSLAVAHVAAKPKSNTTKSTQQTYIAPLQTSFVLDINTGKILHNDNAHKKIYPASITKLMTLYLAFDALEKGKISMHTMLPVSKHAQSMKPGKLWLTAGQKISVHDAILSLIVKSANDSSVVIAEALAGSEDKFAQIMTMKAKELGMYHTQFANASGWHDKRQYSTASDLAKLGLAIREDHRKYYPLFRKTSFVYKGNMIKGHDKVVAQYVGAEGLKTGFHSQSGFNLMTTASRNGKSLLAVVTGGQSAAHRTNRMVTLLDRHFGLETTGYQPPAASPKKSNIRKKYPDIKLASSKKPKKRSKIRRA